ncbi:glycosyltransferase family 4 protein [Hutsoniella sourekii]|uniref:glycosyltransferase family 4 protein n=1 Tax=Hutsoniella sourekii TaxID=87650 RepID=UPI000483BF38|nr:glycosyltransferase family 4 protein [Hutsoniella sourekii]
MRILHINSYFSTTGLFKEFYDRQVQAGDCLDVYVPISDSYPEDRLATSGDYTSVVRSFKQYERWLFPIKHQKILKDLKRRYNANYDIIHGHSLFSNGWLAYQMAKELQIPFIVSVRNADIRTFFQKMPWMRKLGLEILQEAHEIIFISKNAYNEVFDHYIPKHLKSKLQAKCHIIPNGIDDFWHKNRYVDKEAKLHRPLRIISTGKLMALKRFVQLAEMTKEYHLNIQPLELHIVGPAWSQRIKEQLLKYPHVTYHGSLAKEELSLLYREMDLFAMLSSPETFGLVYVEAMSQGLPVIYTQGEGFDSFFPNYQVGVSVGKSDQLGLNAALDYIQNHYQELSSQALQASEIFRWDQIVDHYRQIYQSVIKEHEEDTNEKS